MSSVKQNPRKINRGDKQRIPEEGIKLKAVEYYRDFYRKLTETTAELLLTEIKLSTELFRELKTIVGKEITTPKHWLVFDIVGPDGEFLQRVVFQSDFTAAKIIASVQRKAQTVLFRGIFYIPREVWKEYKTRYEEVRKNPKLSFEIFKLDKLVRVGDAVLIDLDNVGEADVKRFVKYLHRLGIYPEVWKSASGKGYHIYIHLIYKVIRKKEAEDERFYEFPYVSDYRIELIEKALKEILKRLGIPYDSVSAKRAVWLEGVFNFLKKGKSEKVFNGAIHRIDKVYEKLRPLWEKELKEQALRKIKRKPRRGEFKVTAELEFELTDASNPVEYIQANLHNGTITRLLNRGLEIAEVGEILASHYQGDEKAFWRAWEKAEEFISATFKPLSVNASNSPRGKRKRKHRHYWEYIPAIKQCLEAGITSAYAIAKKTGIPKASILEIFRLFTKEVILNQTEEVIRFLKANQKGGNKLPAEKARQLGRQRFNHYFEKLLEEFISSKRKGGEKKVKYEPQVSSPLFKPIDVVVLEFSSLKNSEEKKDKLTSKVTKEGRQNLLIKTRIDKPLSITPKEWKGMVDGRKLLERGNSRRKAFFTKIRTRDKRILSAKQPSLVSNSRFRDKQEKFVIFYGKKRRASEVERIKPLIVARRINSDSWQLYKEAVARLVEMDVWVIESRESEELLEKGTAIVGRKLLKLIKYLYAQKFQKVDLRKKPTLEEVLEKEPVKELDLGGWGRYAAAVKRVLEELGLIDERTQVKLPNLPKEVECAGCEEEVNEYWEIEEETDLLLEEERKLNQPPQRGTFEIENPPAEGDNGDDDELWKLLFG